MRKKPPPILQHCRDLLVTLSEAQLPQIFLNMFDLFIQYRIAFKHNLSYSFTTELPLVLNMFLLFYILSCVFVQSYAMVLLLAHCLMKGGGGGAQARFKGRVLGIWKKLPKKLDIACMVNSSIQSSTKKKVLNMYYRIQAKIYLLYLFKNFIGCFF